ncbi:AraC family transcriptional regulator [Burkholderia sp. WAC0059]|uniref:AraC family transcriptional regulator n=1 Tax=Burkholderia sp. WAC0059 TaxID=2066022 RepID=UPI000C7F7567|nr:AraC family transcriptional regulator [Burkholderia sp. WAC0059]PLZ00403.1 AraC family transcriptional regulator [Burkholderia sp. WAC0059]
MPDSLGHNSRLRLAARILELTADTEVLPTAIPNVTVFRRPGPVAPQAVIYEPSLAIIAQGGKRTIVGNETYIHDDTHFLLTAIDLPTIVEVINATEEMPYLSILLKLDLRVVRELITEIDMLDVDPTSQSTGTAIGPSTETLFEDAVRLLDLLDESKDIPIMSRIIMRGMFYRVLTSPAGARLRQIVHAGTQSNRIAKVVNWLRENYLQPLRIEDLAAMANMGVSTLHHHFRLLTAMSPLQYQKQLRLHEARRLMLNDGLDTKSAAVRVGYESTTQFNREYRRQFGAPPMTDIRALRNGDPSWTLAVIRN